MSWMRRIALAALCALSLVGCGGSTSGSATGTASGAEVAPADALAFVSIDTDRSSSQWKQGDALLEKFPIRKRLVAEIERALAEEGVSFSRDVLPALGPELDIVVLKGASGTGPQVVGMTQPRDEQKLEALLGKSKERTYRTKVGDWTVFSDTQQALDAITKRDGNLSDSSEFANAMGELPEAANAKAYVNGSSVRSVLPTTATGPLPVGSLKWLSLGLSSEDAGWKLGGAWKSTQDSGVNSFEPTLLDKVPAGSLVVASFKGNDQAFTQLRDAPGAQEYLGQLQQALGVGFDDLTRLFSDEGVLYVQKSAPLPEVTLILKEKDASAAMRTVNTLAARAATLLRVQLTETNAAGTVKKLSFDRFAIYYGIDDGNLVVSDSIAPFGRKVDSTIEDDPVFEEAKDTAGLPDESAGFAYVNVQELVPVVEGFAQVSGATVPLDMSANLAPLQSFLTYATAADDVSRFGALLRVR